MNLQNKSIVLNVVLAIAVVVLGVRLVSGVEDTVESQTQEQVVLNNIATRTSIRDYEARPVEKEKVEKMLRAAMAAPTAFYASSRRTAAAHPRTSASRGVYRCVWQLLHKTTLTGETPAAWTARKS